MEELRKELVAFIKRKFYSRPNIYDVAEDIVHQSFLDVLRKDDPQKLNFGYLSTVCIHIAYDLFKRSDKAYHNGGDRGESDCLSFLNAQDVVDEIIEKENVTEILDSLDILKQIERIIILQRYYGDYSFSEIALSNGLKLNTVLSHHRRALEKLRPRLSQFACTRSKTTAIPPQANTGRFSKYF